MPADPSEDAGVSRDEAIVVRVCGCSGAVSPTRTVRSADLFADATTVFIAHAGEQYRLIQTKNGKLLLQK